MALSIRNVYAEKLARDSAKRSGKSITQVIINALEDYLIRIKGNSKLYDIEREIIAISNRCKNLPEIDKRTVNEILGYNSIGDCCTYALSKSSNQSILFKGNDFNQTDINVVLY